MRRRISTGSDYERLVGYSRALVIGEWVFVSGTTGRDHETGEIPDDVVAQTHLCFRTIGRALEEAGSCLADVVRGRIIMADRDDDARVAPVVGSYLKPIGPALTTFVAALLDPRLRIEIEVTALIGSADLRAARLAIRCRLWSDDRTRRYETERSNPMRARIKSLALDLLIQHGYRGVSFGDLAAALDTTRANIHYHFGHKQTLVEEVLLDYVCETTAMMREIWTVSHAPLVDKIARNVEYSRKRYQKYNKPGREGRNWSLIARMRQDSAMLTPKGHEALQQFSRDLSACITTAIEDAKRRGEFVDGMPVEDVALQLVGIANSAAPITQDAGNFDRLEQLYMGFTRIVTHAFGAARPGAKRHDNAAGPQTTAPAAPARRPKQKPGAPRP